MTWLWALMDLSAHVAAIGKLRGRWGFGQSFTIFLAALFLSIPCAWAFWTTDQLSTWHWLQPLRTFLAAPVPGTTVTEGGDIVSDGHTVMGPDRNSDGVADPVEIAGKVLDFGTTLAIMIWCLNLSPTLIQIAFPPLVRSLPANIIAGIVIFLKASMLFDYVSDFPDMWRLITAFKWPDWWILTPILQFVTCLLATLISSMVLQTVLGSLIALMFVCVWNMAFSGVASARGVVVDA